MIEFLNSAIIWWHWIIFGFILFGIELLFGTLVVSSFGVGAIVVGIVSYFFNIPLVYEVVLWIAISIISVFVVKKYEDKAELNTIGQSEHGLDTQGVVTENIEANGRGKVVFDSPILGSREWIATSKDDIFKDARVEIVEILGQLIEVKKIKKEK